MNVNQYITQYKAISDEVDSWDGIIQMENSEPKPLSVDELAERIKKIRNKRTG